MCNLQYLVILTQVLILQNYPNYYGIIKQPINLKIIRQKLEGNCYEDLNELESDFLLMFDNVFKFNKSTSQVYKVNVFVFF